jgi:hypothetical protein
LPMPLNSRSCWRYEETEATEVAASDHHRDNRENIIWLC